MERDKILNRSKDHFKKMLSVIDAQNIEVPFKDLHFLIGVCLCTFRHLKELEPYMHEAEEIVVIEAFPIFEKYYRLINEAIDKTDEMVLTKEKN